MNNNIILDTHVLLWILLEPEEISDPLKKQINLAQKNNHLLISSISLWEIAMLAYKKRIDVYEPIASFLDSISNLNGLTIIDISPEIAATSTALGEDFHGDPADRIISATAKTLKATLLTRDKKILNWAKLGNVKYVKV